MITIGYLNPPMLIAGEGKVLTNGDTYTTVVYLGAEEDPKNWTEINESDVPEQAESEEN